MGRIDEYGARKTIDGLVLCAVHGELSVEGKGAFYVNGPGISAGHSLHEVCGCGDDDGIAVAGTGDGAAYRTPSHGGVGVVLAETVLGSA